MNLNTNLPLETADWRYNLEVIIMNFVELGSPDVFLEEAILPIYCYLLINSQSMALFWYIFSFFMDGLNCKIIQSRNMWWFLYKQFETTWKGRSGQVNCFWPSPAESFLVQSPAGLMAIFCCLTTLEVLQLHSWYWSKQFWPDLRHHWDSCQDRLRKPQKTEVRTDCLRTKIWTRNLPNSKQEY
jgi:hypothetical protein